MRRLRTSSEAEMVALFLRTDLPSDRWRDDAALTTALKSSGRYWTRQLVSTL
jgi:hypothetical protein